MTAISSHAKLYSIASYLKKPAGSTQTSENYRTDKVLEEHLSLPSPPRWPSVAIWDTILRLPVLKHGSSN